MYIYTCDRIQEKAFAGNADAQIHWNAFNEQARRFRWPDRPVLLIALKPDS
jgi:hypothetical protein